MRRTPTLLVAVAISGLLAVSGCSGGSTSNGSPSSSTTPSSSGTNGILDIAYGTEIATLDPAQVCDVPSDTLVQNLYDDLVQTGVSGSTSDPSQIKPMLATSWTVSKDLKTYTFQLRHGVTFHNGDPLTAADVIYSYKRDEAQNGCAAYVLTGGLYDIKSITAPTQMSVKFVLKQPDPLFLLDQTVHIGILDKKLVDAHGGSSKAGTTWLGSHEAGSGPFMLKSYDPTSEIVLVRNPNYWGGPAASKEVDIHIATDPSALQLLARGGQADLTYGIQLSHVDQVASQSNLKVISAPGLGYTNIGLNTKVPPLNNLTFRQALATATPFDQIRTTFTGKYGVPFVGPIMKGELFYKPYANPYPFNIAKAKELVAQSGVTDPHLSIDVEAGETDPIQIVTTLQSIWKQAGITLSIHTLGSSAWTKDVDAFKDQMYITQDKSDVPDPAFMLGYFVHCHDSFNWTAYCDPKANSDLEAARTSTSSAQRAQLYNDLSVRIIHDVPYLELYQSDQVVLAKPSVAGYVSYVDSCPRWKDVVA